MTTSSFYSPFPYKLTAATCEVPLGSFSCMLLFKRVAYRKDTLQEAEIRGIGAFCSYLACSTWDPPHLPQIPAADGKDKLILVLAMPDGEHVAENLH